LLVDAVASAHVVGHWQCFAWLMILQTVCQLLIWTMIQMK